MTGESDNGGNPHNADGAAMMDEMKRLTKGLLQVPKAELDERVKKDKAERRRRAARKK
jgi:hypothetical protein